MQGRYMDFEWMEAVPALKKLKSALYLRKRTGDLFGWIPKTGIVPKPKGRRSGISALMRLKNESRWIETALRSLAPFVDQFSIVDNGSTDGTPEIVKRVCDDLGIDYVLEILPTEDFGEVCDRALENTTCRWILRWDGDMIARTTGDMTLAKLRDFIGSLDPDIYYAIYFPHIRLEGDLFHQDPDYRLHYEDWLFTWSPKLYHKRTGRFREVIYPYYYKRLNIRDTYSFHIASLDSPDAMILRKYWVEWRTLNDTNRYPTLETFTYERIRKEYGTDSMEEAGALYCRERFRYLVRYDPRKSGGYPELLKSYLDSDIPRIVYRSGKIAGRSDIMEMLDTLDADMRETNVDVIMATRGRLDMAIETAEKLLEQDYPNYRIIVIDQNDSPIEGLDTLAESHENLIHHIAASRGLPAGRNEGIGLSEAEIVIFVDDDVIPEPGFIEGHVFAYRNRSIGGAGGKVTELRPGMMKPVPSSKIGKLDYWFARIHRGFTYDRPLDIDSAQGVNMSFRRSVLEEANGFDTGYAGMFLFEETDVCLTIREKGFTIRYTPDASLTHIGAPSGGCRIVEPERRIYWYAHNFMLLFLKHYPRRVFPVWFTLQCGKFVRDSIKQISLKPLLAGIKGMIDGAVTYTRSKRSQ